MIIHLSYIVCKDSGKAALPLFSKVIIVALVAAVTLLWNVLSWSACNPCSDKIENCAVSPSGQIDLGRSQTKAFDVYCPKATPYYRGFCYDRDSKAAKVYEWNDLGWFGDTHGHYTATNWSPTSHHWVNVRAACSTNTGSGTCMNAPDGCIVTDNYQVCVGNFCFTYWYVNCPDGYSYICDNHLVFRTCCNKMN